jgi:hypothetical protein
MRAGRPQAFVQGGYSLQSLQLAEIQRTGAATLKAIAQELEARGVRTPAGRDHWDAKQVSRLLVA